jgi:type 1 glutamine amidotransferase
MSLNKIVLGMALAACTAAPSFSQTKPAETTSKVKKVLHYTKVGGWVHTDGIKDMTDVLNVLAKKKGFTVTHTADQAQINLANLKTYSAIIWDNNVDGGASIPDVSARQAVIDYVTAGGGWLLVHGAGDHKNNWPALQTLLGTTFSTHGDQGAGDITFDAEAKAHKELKFMIQDLPPMARITKDEWYAFQNTVRGKAGVTVVAIAGNGPSNVILPLGDNSKPADHTYIWAKEMGTGRTLYTAIGHGGNQLYAQADSFSTKNVWENLRYVAGDYKNGCTNKTASNYDSTSRVDNGTCASTSVNGFSGKTHDDLNVNFSAFKGQGVTLAFTHSGKYSVELRNASGALVWSGHGLDQQALEINHPLRSGIYYLKANSGKNSATQKVILL